MKSLIRMRARKDDGTVELTIGLSRGLLIGIMVIALGVMSLGYAVMPAQSEQSKQRGKRTFGSSKLFSEVVEAGDFVFLSGKLGFRGGKVVPGGIRGETEYVMEGLKRALAKSGLGWEDVVKTTVYIESFDDYAGMNEVYQSYFQKDPPARTAIQTGVITDSKIEIEVIAYRGGK